MRPSIIRWGILGCGKIAEKIVEDILSLEDATLIAVASRDQTKANEFGARYQVEKCYGTYLELVQDSNVDVVYIATIHPYHAETSLLCLAHGKHVMCEKPLAMNEQEVKSLIELAKSKKLFLMEAIWTRFFPVVKEAMSLIEGGEIGKVKSIEADFGFKANPKITRLFDKKLGGGSLLDIGIYPLFLCLIILGVPDRIDAEASFTFGGVDESCRMKLNYDSGAEAVLNSTIAADTKTEAWIHGSEASIKLHRRFHNPSKLSVWKEDKIVDELTVPIDGNGYTYEISHVNDCLRKGLTESAILPHEISLSLIKMLDETRREIGLEY